MNDWISILIRVTHFGGDGVRHKVTMRYWRAGAGAGPIGKDPL